MSDDPLMKLYAEGLELQGRIDRAHFAVESDPSWSVQRTALLASWRAKLQRWIEPVHAHLSPDPLEVGRFRNAPVASSGLVGTDVEWNGIRNVLSASLDPVHAPNAVERLERVR